MTQPKLYLVMHRDSMGSPTLFVYRHETDEQLLRSGNVVPGDEVQVYEVTDPPRKYRVESAHPPVKLVGRDDE